MPKIPNQSTNWDFTVQRMRMHLADGTPLNEWANIRTDTKQSVGVVSEKGYGLLQNGGFVGTVREALDGLGLVGYQESILTTDDGRRLYATYTWDNRVRTIAKVGDKVGLRLRFSNSFDGSCCARGELMAMVLRCLNGMTLPEAEFSLYQRHNPKINMDFARKVIANAVTSFDASLAVFDKLANKAITDEQGVTILSNLPIAERTAEAIGNIWLRPSFAESHARTLYALYDAVTEYLRDVEAKRFEHAAKTNRAVLRRLLAGLDDDGFNALTTKIIEIDTSVQIEENQ